MYWNDSTQLIRYSTNLDTWYRSYKVLIHTVEHYTLVVEQYQSLH